MFISKKLMIVIGTVFLMMCGISMLFALRDLPAAGTRSSLHVKEIEVLNFNGTKELGKWMMCSVSGMWHQWNENTQTGYNPRGVQYRLTKNCANPEYNNNCAWQITAWAYRKEDKNVALWVTCWNTAYK